MEKRSRPGYVFVLPWIIGFAVFTAYPLFNSLYFSFNSVSFAVGGIETEFIGAQNFREALSADIDFIRQIGSFSIISVIAIPVIVISALVLALLLNMPLRGRGFFRTIFFLPVIISSGPVIDRLMDMGATSLSNLSDYAFYTALTQNGTLFANALLFILNSIIILLWFTGAQILVFLAGLQKIDNQTIEAARVDGASNWEIFWKITLPGLTALILVNIIYTTVMFAQSSLNPVITHITRNMFDIHRGFGYSSALAWLYFLIITLIMLALIGVFALFNKDRLA